MEQAVVSSAPLLLPFKTRSNQECNRFLQACVISVTDSATGSSIYSSDSSRLQLRDEACKVPGVDIGNLTTLKVPLNTDDPWSLVTFLTLCVSSNQLQLSERVEVPIVDSGCRVTYYTLQSLGLTMCLVHDVVTCTTEIDSFIEEQDFLYNCMEIQEKLFLRDDATMLANLSGLNSPKSTQEDDISHELENMNKILNRYHPALT